MIFQTIFTNHFEILIPEIYLSLIILSFLLFGIFYKNTKKNQKYLIIKTLNNLNIFFLFLLIILLINTKYLVVLLANETLMLSSLTQFTKIFLILGTILFLLLQEKYLINQKIFFYEINILISISLLGLFLLISSNNFFIFYLAIELQSLSFYILTASKKNSFLSIEASLKYFILGSIASSFLLLGISFLYGITGSLTYNHLILILSNISYNENTNILIGLIYSFFLILIGIFFKIGVAPFHFWLPDVYEGSPNNITFFFVIIPKIAFLIILIKFFYFIFSDISIFLENIFYICSLFSMFIGSFSAIMQKKIKRLLAYSSINHVGFIFLGFVSNNLNNIPFILLYIFFYILMSINIWISYLSIYINFKPIKYLTDLSNFVQFNKLLSFLIVINFFSMAGIPPLAGFFSKFFILKTIVQNNNYLLICIFILISIISSFYYLKFIKIIFFEKNNKILFIDSVEKIQSYILIFFNQIIIFFFLFPNFVLTFLNKIYLLLLI